MKFITCTGCSKQTRNNPYKLCSACRIYAPIPKQWSAQEQELINWFIEQVQSLSPENQQKWLPYVRYFSGKPTDQDKGNIAIEALHFLRSCVQQEQSQQQGSI